MAAAVASPSSGHRHDSLFLSVFPKTNFTTPTPESTPNIGSISSPGAPFGGFGSFREEPDETVRFTRAWSTATRHLALSTQSEEGRPVGRDILEAFFYLLQNGQSQKDLAAWYANEIGVHLRTFVLPELQAWEQPIPLSKANDVLRDTLQLLLNAQQYYISRLETLISSIPPGGRKDHVTSFRTQALRSFHTLVLHSLPQQRLQKTLTGVIYQRLEQSLLQSSNPERCLKDGQCHCQFDLSQLPLSELHEVGLGGLIGERAFAQAIHRLLQGPGIERRCFQVDWTGHRSVLTRLRSWMSSLVIPQVERALAALKGNNWMKLGAADAEQLTSIAVNNLGHSRTSSLFDYVKAWPASTGAILDIWEYLSAGTQTDKAHVCQSFIEQMQRRLLHAGASTSDILGLYVNVIHAFKALDGRGVLLEKVAVPIRNYLRARDDTVTIIAVSFLADVDENGNVATSEVDRVCTDITLEVSNTALGGSSEHHMLNWDDMEWMPDPIDAGPDYRSSKSEDVIAQILGLFEQEEFITEVTSVLAQHLLHATDPSFVKETRLVELLKSRLDATKLQAADVMLKDMRDSVALGKRINPLANYGTDAAPTPKEIQAAITEGGITLSSLYRLFQTRIKRSQFMAAVKLVANKRGDLYYPKRTGAPAETGASLSKNGTINFKTQILSSFFWPELRSDEFRIPQALEPLQNTFEKKFGELGSQRRLHFRPALARVSVRLDLEDRTIEESDVPAWRASVIDAFQDYDDTVGLTAEQLAEMLQMDEELVMDALHFWTSKSVLFQLSAGAYAVLERLDMEIEPLHQQAQHHDDMISAVKSQDAMFRESAPMFETFIANMLRNQGAKEIGGMMGITSLLKMVLPTFTYGDEEVILLLSDMEKKGQVKRNDGLNTPHSIQRIMDNNKDHRVAALSSKPGIDGPAHQPGPAIERRATGTRATNKPCNREGHGWGKRCRLNRLPTQGNSTTPASPSSLAVTAPVTPYEPQAQQQTFGSPLHRCKAAGHRDPRGDARDDGPAETPASKPNTTRPRRSKTAKTTIQPHNEQPQSRLLTLPRELRDMIISHLLTQPTAIYTNLLINPVANERSTVDAYLALSLTSRQIHHEAHHMFFRSNSFAFHAATWGRINLPAIPARSVKVMRRFELYRWRAGAEVRLVCRVAGRVGEEEVDFKVVCGKQLPIPGRTVDEPKELMRAVWRVRYLVCECVRAYGALGMADLSLAAMEVKMVWA
ncbi:uncharacterized protein LTR77_003070 [Saxophila tyrrhenica]|uniref:Cullin family profile domain-containing protein n=1 Tax=Saxophila tyrrhenica TaxID=1690608 RepID=A0AAV9PI31_9PEZI|nr:hypothetical protein LTR77_003070 [Saxophila tyrrhenica]